MALDQSYSSEELEKLIEEYRKINDQWKTDKENDILITQLHYLYNKIDDIKIYRAGQLLENKVIQSALKSLKKISESRYSKSGGSINDYLNNFNKNVDSVIETLYYVKNVKSILGDVHISDFYSIHEKIRDYADIHYQNFIEDVNNEISKRSVETGRKPIKFSREDFNIQNNIVYRYSTRRKTERRKEIVEQRLINQQDLLDSLYGRGYRLIQNNEEYTFQYNLTNMKNLAHAMLTAPPKRFYNGYCLEQDLESLEEYGYDTKITRLITTDTACDYCKNLSGIYYLSENKERYIEALKSFHDRCTCSVSRERFRKDD